MVLKVTTNNIQDSALAIMAGPRITGVQVTDSGYTVLDDTAVDIAGGYIKIIGANFVTGCQVLIESTAATSVTFVSSSEVRAQLPATAAGTYILYLVNPNGDTAIRVNAVTFSTTPTWVTSSSLTGDADAVISLQLNATGASTYSLQAGSSLPVGLTLSNVGLISGTVTGLSSETVYNFTILATDAELQDSPRSFSITISVGDPYFSYVTTLISAGNTGNTFIKDSSTNNFLVTVTGDTRPNNFNPYTPGYYSNFFDGTGDYLTTSNSNEFIASTNGFTIEAWVYYTSITNFSFIVASTTGANNYNPYWFIGSTSGGNWRISWGDATAVDVGVAIVIGTWNHVAMVMGSDGSGTFYVNGVSRATTTGKTLNGSATGIAIAHGGGDLAGQYLVTGYISNVRYVKNNTVYTSAFTLPTAPLAVISGTSLLTCRDNRLIDSSSNNFTITRTGDVSVSAFEPFAPNTSYASYGSTYFDGTGDELTWSGVSIGSNQYTFECWFYNTGTFGIIGMLGTTAGSGLNIRLNSATQINVDAYNNSATGFVVPTMTVRQWYHLVVCRGASNQTTVFLNGVRSSTGAVAISTSYSTSSRIGASIELTNFSGYMSDVRLVVGSTVYDPTQTTITVPSAPLAAVANTNLLICQYNRPANNSVFIDAGPNSSVINRLGNPTQGTFSPYGAGWSNYFDGTGDYLTAPNTVSNFGTGDFTIEAWFYKTVSAGKPVVSNQDGGTNNNYFVLDATNAQATYQVRDDSSQAYAYGPTLTANTWNHIAVSRNSGTVRVFVNGVSGTPVTITKTVTSRLTVIGGFLYTGFENYFSGYISNLRIIKGTALYTANFTPSGTPLQPIANTSLLTCTDPYFIDDSSNNFTLTRNGDVRVQKFSPFAGTVLPAPYYSAYFDGVDDYLSITNTTALTLTADYTAECWFYATSSVSASQTLIWLNGNTDAYAAVRLGIENNGITFHQANTSLSWGINTGAIGPTLVVNTWYHVAVSKSGSSIRVFLNGTQIGSTYTSGAVYNGTLNYIGALNYSAVGDTIFRDFTGYISNVRIIKGTALYTTAFTTPTAPLTAITDTSLLTCQNNTFVDNSTNVFTVTANGNSQPTTFAPFTASYSRQSYTPATYAGSMYFDGTGDYLTVSSAPIYLFPGDFTIEGWMYFTNTGGGSPQVLFGVKSGTTEFDVRWFTTRWQVSLNAGSGTDIGTTPAPVNNSWTHVACVRSGSSIKLYVNGVATATTLTNSSTLGQSASSPSIGASNTGSNIFTGFISDVRVVKGLAIYTSNFVPPVAPLDISSVAKNTVLAVNGSGSSIYDSSMQVNIETVADVKCSTSVVKFAGGSSIYFDGAGDYLDIANSVLNQLSGISYTIEMWLYPTTSGTERRIFNKNGSGTFGYLLYLSTGNVVCYRTDSTNMTAGTATANANTWTHVAVTHDGTTTRIYVNGSLSTSSTGVTITSANEQVSLRIGARQFDASLPFTGYISDIRLTRGHARYTENFTPLSESVKTK